MTVNATNKQSPLIFDEDYLDNRIFSEITLLAIHSQMLNLLLGFPNYNQSKFLVMFYNTPFLNLDFKNCIFEHFKRIFYETRFCLCSSISFWK